MSTDATALIGMVLSVLGCLVAVLGLVAGAPVLLVATGTATSIGGAVLVNRTARSKS